jgi:hypothetical protein
MVLSCSIFIVGKLVFALEGTAYHHAIIESQPFFNGNDELVVFITWVTAPHYKKREVLCDEVKELPSKRIRKSPEQYFFLTPIIHQAQYYAKGVTKDRQNKVDTRRNDPNKTDAYQIVTKEGRAIHKKRIISVNNYR